MPRTAGTFGNTSGLGTSGCSGSCFAVPGRYCPLGATAPYGVLCPLGRYSNVSNVQECALCPGGTPGETAGLNTSACSTICQQGSASSPGDSSCHYCPIGFFSPGAGSSACTPCPAGLWSSDIGATLCGGICIPSAGRYCPVAWTTSVAVLCAPGWFSQNGSLTSCDPCPAGWNCPGRGCTMPVACGPGTYSVTGAARCSFCPPGRFSGDFGAVSCQGNCVTLPGFYCGSGVSTGFASVPCPPGRFTNVTGPNLACQPCPSGRYGASSGVATAECDGLCVPTSGRYCAAGATTVTGAPCPVSRYSVAGSMDVCDPWSVHSLSS